MFFIQPLQCSGAVAQLSSPPHPPSFPPPTLPPRLQIPCCCPTLSIPLCSPTCGALSSILSLHPPSAAWLPRSLSPVPCCQCQPPRTSAPDLPLPRHVASSTFAACHLRQRQQTVAAAAPPAPTTKSPTLACHPSSLAAASVGLCRSQRTVPPPSTSPATARSAETLCPGH